MDTLHLGIITLLRSAMNGEALALPEGFDWEKASHILYNHHLTGLAIQGASACGISRRDPSFAWLTAKFCDILRTSRMQTQKLQEVFALFDANGIDYMPVKGAVIKPLYAKPEYRYMGDSDVLIRMEQYPQICALLTGAGMEKTDECDYEITWQNEALTLELHSCLVSKLVKKYFAYYSDSWRFARKCDGTTRYCLSAEDHFVYLLVHFAKHHFFGSVCAKDICDFWVFKNAHPDMDEAYILRQLDRMQLRKFYKNILDLLDCWFLGKPATQAVEKITYTAFSGGVSEQYNDAAAKGTLQRYAAEGNSVLKKKLTWFFHALFPDRVRLSYTYPILKKWPVLLPVFWVVRWFRAVFCERDRIKRGVIVMKMDSEDFAEYSAQLSDIGIETD